MLTSLRTRLFALALLFLAAPLAVAQDALTYQTPAPDLAALVDAPRTPAVSLSPDRTRMAFLTQPGLPGIDEVAQPELGLGGTRINPATTGPSRARASTGLAFRAVDATGDPRPVTGLPATVRLRNLAWSPDGTRAAFTLDREDRIELWTADVATGQARRWIEAPLNDAAPGAAVQWLPDSRGVVARIVPAGRGAAPVERTVPTGPVVQQSLGDARPARTYQDLLKSPHDEALFDHYMTGQLVLVALDGTTRALGAPAVVTDFEPSPDGRYLLVESLSRPYSYLVPASRFPTATRIHDLQTGAVVHTVADLPLAESIPIAFGSVRTGPRSVQWRADQPATLAWVEAQDGGDAGQAADIRDQMFQLAAPFSGPAVAGATFSLRFSTVLWGDAETAVAAEYWWPTRMLRWTRLHPDEPSATPDVLFEGSYQDRYNSFGAPMTEPTPDGTRRLVLDDGALFLTDAGASPEGNRPWLRRLDLATGETTELFRSAAPHYESPAAWLDVAAGQILTRRETATEPPNYYRRDLDTGDVTALTAFPHPYPQLAGIQRETIEYTRADGVPLSAVLYLPAGYDAERDGPLPTFVWAYPEEFRSAADAGQRSDSPYQFAWVSYWGAVPFVTRGYAVLDDAAFPIVGEGEAEPNDTFIQQLVMNGEAVIAEGARRGVVDPDRVAVGGHSYGAFMTANLLAHSDLFRTGIARSGAYNRTLTPFGFQYEQRSYWDAPALYNGMSPFMNADKIDEPILMIHGQADNNPGTFTLQSERLYGALQGLGGTARLVLLPAESHGYAARESILHMLWEQDRWLETYVKNAGPRETAGDAPTTGTGG